MERTEAVKLKSGSEFDSLFPRARLVTIVKKKGATVADTIKFIPQVVQETLFHTQRIANEVLLRQTTEQTCKAIWEFVHDHIAYRKDEDGKEQVRSPARTWHDRALGVDCDCYTVFISSILSNLNIRHILRITKYKEDHFQHIYPIVPLNNGRYITMDCVVKSFDYEEPYSEKKDTTMDLEYLNGISDAVVYKKISGATDEKELMGELGKKGKLKAALKKGLHVTNRLNPATAVLRAGILASAKLNVMKISQRLKYSYLSDEEAQKRGIDMGKFAKLKKVREKLENIFYGAGGKPENLKKAILTGRGNRNHDVNGLGVTPDAMEGMDEQSSMSNLLGTEMYQSELADINGLGELGVVTAGAITMASGVMGVIASIIKGIGNIFPNNKDKSSQDYEDAGKDTASADNSKKTADEENKNAEGKSSFWENNKKWIKPAGIGFSVLGLFYAGYRLIAGKKEETAPVAQPPPTVSPALTGIQKKKSKPKPKNKSDKKEIVELL